MVIHGFLCAAFTPDLYLNDGKLTQPHRRGTAASFTTASYFLIRRPKFGSLIHY